MAPLSGYSRTSCVFLLCCLGMVGCPQSDHGDLYFAGTRAYGTSVAASPLGGCYVLGNEGHILKLSESSKLEWTQRGGDTASIGVAVSDGGFVQVRRESVAGVAVAKWSREGERVWTHGCGVTGAGSVYPESIVATGDGGCAIAAWSYPEDKVFLLRLDGDGAVVWEGLVESFGRGTRHPKLLAMANDGFAVTADCGNSLVIARVDSDGEARWSKAYENTGDWMPGGTAAALSDGGIMVVRGSRIGFACVIRTDAEGNVGWMTKNIGTLGTAFQTHAIHDMLLDGQGRVVLVGDATTNLLADGQIGFYCQGFIAQLDGRGRVNWTRTVGPLARGQSINGVALTRSGDYITTGSLDDGIHVMRVRPDGSIW